MTFVEIQNKMGLIWEELKTVEVRLQNARADLDKALRQELTTKEGLEEVNKHLKSTKSSAVVFIERVTAAQKDVDTVTKFHDQSVARRCVLQGTVANTEAIQKKLQEGYDALGVQLAKADRNVIRFGT